MDNQQSDRHTEGSGGVAAGPATATPGTKSTDTEQPAARSIEELPHKKNIDYVDLNDKGEARPPGGSDQDRQQDGQDGAGRSDAAPELGVQWILIRNLLFRRGRRIILRDINLDVAQGTVMAIIGMSGCGKSTLLRLIGGLERPDRGQIFLGGTDIAPMRERELQNERMSMGFVFQGAALFDYLTVFENVAFPLRRHSDMPESEIRQRVADRLALVGLEGTEDRLPAELSGGMQKRVGLARAIAGDPSPQTLLYDEPTSGLDPIMTAVTNDLIVRVRDELGVTSVVVTHDMGSLQFADQVAMLHGGIVEAVGTPQEIASSTNPVVEQFVHGRATGPIDVGTTDVEL